MKKPFQAFFIAAVFYGIMLFAQQTGPLVAEVRFQGLAVTSQAEALASISMKPGTIFSQRALNFAIKDLNAMQRFRSVFASTAETPGGVIVTFTLEEESLIDKIIYEGVGLTKSSKVKELNDIKPGTAFRETKARTAVFKMKEYYRSEGYLEADIKYRFVPVKQLPGRYDLIYSVAEGPKIVVREVIFKGAVNIKPKKLLSVMKTQKRLWIFRSGVLKEDEFLADKERIIGYYKKNGYLDADVTSYKWSIEDISTTNKAGEVTKTIRGITISVDINEGVQYTVGDFRFEGYNIITLTELKKFINLKLGTVYDQEKVDEIRTAIYKKYSDNGYLFANVSALQEKKEGMVVDTTFVISEGKRSHIGSIRVSGNTKTYPSVIRYFIQISEGELYVNRKLEQSFNRLGQTQFFTDVRILPQPSPIEGLVDLEFVVTENQTGQIELNLGWGTQSGFSIGLKLSEKNLLGRGWYLGIKGEYGQYRQLGEVTFTNPFIFLSPFSFTFIIGVYNTIYTDIPTDENNDGIIDGTGLDYINKPKETLVSYGSTNQYTRLNFRAGIAFGVQFKVYWNASLGYDFNIFSDYDANFTRPLRYNNGWEVDQELIDSLGFGWTIQNTIYTSLRFNNTDGGLWPTRGVSSSLYLSFSGGGLGGDIHFMSLAYSFDFYYKLFWKVTWVFHYDMGFLFPYPGLFVYRDANRLAFDGVYKMRGWINYLLRGEAISYFSMELRVPIWQFVGVVGFMDIGSVSSSYKDFTWNTSNYIMSVGLGLAINLSILPIRLYVARPIEWRDGGFKPTGSGDFWKEWQFVFSIQGLF